VRSRSLVGHMDIYADSQTCIRMPLDRARVRHGRAGHVLQVIYPMAMFASHRGRIATNYMLITMAVAAGAIARCCDHHYGNYLAKPHTLNRNPKPQTLNRPPSTLNRNPQALHPTPVSEARHPEPLCEG